jgi:hypothetical protein
MPHGGTHGYTGQGAAWLQAVPLLSRKWPQESADHGYGYFSGQCENRFQHTCEHAEHEQVCARDGPVALKLCTDGEGTSAEVVPTDRPVLLVLEHALVERLDVESVR